MKNIVLFVIAFLCFSANGKATDSMSFPIDSLYICMKSNTYTVPRVWPSDYFDKVENKEFKKAGISYCLLVSDTLIIVGDRFSNRKPINYEFKSYSKLKKAFDGAKSEFHEKERYEGDAFWRWIQVVSENDTLYYTGDDKIFRLFWGVLKNNRLAVSDYHIGDSLKELYQRFGLCKASEKLLQLNINHIEIFDTMHFKILPEKRRESDMEEEGSKRKGEFMAIIIDINDNKVSQIMYSNWHSCTMQYEIFRDFLNFLRLF